MTRPASGRHVHWPERLGRLRLSGAVRRRLGAVLMLALTMASVACLVLALSTPWCSTAGPVARVPAAGIDAWWARERAVAPSERSSGARSPLAPRGVVTFEDARRWGVRG